MVSTWEEHVCSRRYQIGESPVLKSTQVLRCEGETLKIAPFWSSTAYLNTPNNMNLTVEST